MPEQALYLKWRPARFENVVGQDHITRTLRNSLATGRIRHAYLFSGPRGTGKTTMARLLAKAVNCLHDDAALHPCNECATCIALNEGRFLDLIEIDAATHTGVDDVRDLRDKIAFTPGEGRYKVYIIDEVHRFTGNAFDALLKTLEEPPDHAIFVLATTEIDKVPATIKSRCLQFEFRRVSLHEVADRLQLIAENEGLRLERPALELIARQGTGSVRDSISLLDQIVADPDEVISLDVVQRILGTANNAAVRELAQALIEGDVAVGLQIINQAIDSGSDPRQFGQQMVEHLRAILLTQTAGSQLVEASAEEHDLYDLQAQHIEREALLRAVRLFNEAVNTFRGGWQPQLSLELALIESVHQPQQVVYVEASTQHGQTAPPQTELPPAPEIEPGSPPVIPKHILIEKWQLTQRAARRYNPSLPALMDHARVYHIDGNHLMIAVANDVFKDKLDTAEKRQGLERALGDVHKTRLHVEIVLAELGQNPSNDTASTAQSDDPLAQLGEELGAEVHVEDEDA